MYGLVNQAVADLVRSTFGEDAWSEIAEKADADEEYLPMDPYPDAVTYRLVAAVSAHAEAEPAAVLESFGEHWTRFTGREGYGSLFDQTGRTVREFVGNLNRLHAQVKLGFPELTPPRFDVLDREDGSFELRYYSEREGLAPMVVGLLRGIGQHTAEVVEVSQVGHRADDGHDTFIVRARPV